MTLRVARPALAAAALVLALTGGPLIAGGYRAMAWTAWQPPPAPASAPTAPQAAADRPGAAPPQAPLPASAPAARASAPEPASASATTTGPVTGLGTAPGTTPGPPPGPRSESGSTTPTATPHLPASVPVHLDIPAIKLHTKLTRLGLNDDGTVEVPPLGGDAPAGWYRNSVTPGEVGAAVLIGHVDSARDGPAVFYRLGDLRPGDDISVRRADGTTAKFQVETVALYPKSNFPTDLVYDPVPYPGLRLVTCGGSFDRKRSTYRSNLVVTAR